MPARRPPGPDRTAPPDAWTPPAWDGRDALPAETVAALLELAALQRQVEAAARRVAECPKTSTELWHAFADSQLADALYARGVAEEWSP